MGKRPILVVGAGLAGLSAAAELAAAGRHVLVADQGAGPGGAIHRQPLPGRRGIAGARRTRDWAALMARVSAQGDRIRMLFGMRLGGIDCDGVAVLSGTSPLALRPLAAILATGARERVRPRPGWTLPGVETAGGLQIRLKTLGEAPTGRILLAGSGPLLLSLGAELCRAGNPPVAILERGRPFARPFAALGLPRSYLQEALAALATLSWHRVPVLTGTEVTSIQIDRSAFTVTAATMSGPKVLTADRIGLHDGIAPNDTGLPDSAAIPILRAGDCREALGARAAEADGRHAARRLLARLNGTPEPNEPDTIRRERAAQARLSGLFAPATELRIDALPDETVICRCEGRTLGDLRALGPGLTPRELRLDGRFGMGPCQGRFCAEWVRAASGLPPSASLGAARWPATPLPVADLLAAIPEPSEGDTP